MTKKETCSKNWVAKLILMAILAISMAFSGTICAETNNLSKTNAVRATTERKLGDVNGDDNVNLNDAKLTLRAAVGINGVTLDEVSKKAADIDLDGNVNLNDAKLVLCMAVGISNNENDNSGEQMGKVLVAYFSASGNTEAVAKTIADYTGGDIFELIPVDEYTSEDLNWTISDSRVNKEHENESLQDIELVSTTVDNLDSYDTVFIGYPIWWGIAAWPVNNFVKNNDFTGKKVIPFCTSTSSGLGNSGRNLAEMSGTGEWQEGQRFRGNASADDVRSWLTSLNIPSK